MKYQLNYNNMKLEDYLIIGSAVQSAKIKKGYHAEVVVRDLLKSKGFNIVKGEKVEFPEFEGSQKSYMPDNVLYYNNEIIIIDNKSGGWNNNTPMDDTLRKYINTKRKVQSTSTQNVRFVLLKNSKSQEDIQYYVDKATPFGIEMVHADTWLSDLVGEDVNLDSLLEEQLVMDIENKIKELKG